MSDYELRQAALQVMIKKMRLIQERYPNNIIAGVVFATPEGIMIVPTNDSAEGIIELQNSLLDSLRGGISAIKEISNRDN